MISLHNHALQPTACRASWRLEGAVGPVATERESFARPDSNRSEDQLN